MRGITLFGITVYLCLSLVAGQHFGAGKNHLNVEPKVAPPPNSGSLLAEADNVRSSARSLSLSDSSNLNGASGKQVTKATPPPSKVQFLNRFDPYDGSTTTINPKLQTLKPGSVQTTTTERTVFVNNRFSEDESKTTTTTTYKPPTTTTRYTTTTAAPAKPFQFQPVAFQPVTFQPVTFQSIPTTTYRPFATSNKQTFAPISSTWFTSATNKPFDIFEYYRQQYNPTKAPAAQPFQFRHPFKPQAILHQQIATQRPFVAVPQVQAVVRDEPKTNPVVNAIPAPALVSAVKPVEQKPEHKPVAVFKPVALVITETKPELVANIVASRFSENEVVKPVVSTPAKENSLEKNVAPPPAVNNQKAILAPKIKVNVADSGHKFINRFIVDESEILAERTIPAKKILEKDIEAPPVKNIRPILSPKISLHIGDSGHIFANRFILTEAEKLGKNTEPIKIIGNKRVASPPVFKAAPTQANAVQTNVKPTLPPPHLPSGRTDFTSRFEVDDVNKQLFQTLGSGASVKPLQQKILFNNRFNEGSNNINLRAPSAFGNSFGSESRVFQTKTSPTGFGSLSSRLPSFENFFSQ